MIYGLQNYAKKIVQKNVAKMCKTTKSQSHPLLLFTLIHTYTHSHTHIHTHTNTHKHTLTLTTTRKNEQHSEIEVELCQKDKQKI